jgi:hypothetical protein
LYYNHPGYAYGAYQGLRTSITVGDIAGDGGKEMIIGNVRGGLELFRLKNYWPDDTPGALTNENGKLRVFPNPAYNWLTLTWTGFELGQVDVAIFNMEGQKLFNANYALSRYQADIYTGDFAQGIYVCVVQVDGKKFYNKFTVIR